MIHDVVTISKIRLHHSTLITFASTHAQLVRILEHDVLVSTIVGEIKAVLGRKTWEIILSKMDVQIVHAVNGHHTITCRGTLLVDTCLSSLMLASLGCGSSRKKSNEEKNQTSVRVGYALDAPGKWCEAFIYSLNSLLRNFNEDDKLVEGHL